MSGRQAIPWYRMTESIQGLQEVLQLILLGRQRRLAALRGIPKAKLDTHPSGIEVLQPIKRVALVVFVRADRVQDDAVGGAAQADRLAVVKILRRFREQLGLDQFIERRWPTTVLQAEALGGEGCDGAVQKCFGTLFCRTELHNAFPKMLASAKSLSPAP